MRSLFQQFLLKEESSALEDTSASMEVMEIEKRGFLEDTDFTTADLKLQ